MKRSEEEVRYKGWVPNIEPNIILQKLTTDKIFQNIKK